MARINLFRKMLALAFAVAVVFTVSVKEVHYLFAFHEAHEHCENHLHQKDAHAHCDICKFDVSGLDDELHTVKLASASINITEAETFYTEPLLHLKQSSALLRGPPATA